MTGGTFEQLADQSAPGSALRNAAARYLGLMTGNAAIETRIHGKKVDIYCEVNDLGRRTSLFVEAKDYKKRLTRASLVEIAMDYDGLLRQSPGSRLLVVTRNGLTTDAQKYVDENGVLRHLTIWDLEDQVLEILPYIRTLVGVFEANGLSHYYVPARARRASFKNETERVYSSDAMPLYEAVDDWLNSQTSQPLAILGGYGAGKSSFSKFLASHYAKKALADPSTRRPIFVELGKMSRAASLDAMLGAMFTNAHEVKGYSFRRFMDMNRKGRFVIILDGFDEMKHAMSWTDFRNQVEELNALNSGDARLIMLGRPSAFTSENEHIHILRGRRKASFGFRKLEGWPEFIEFDIEPFDKAERRSFTRRYLALHLHRMNDGHKHAHIRIARQVNAIADEDAEIFSKPIHSRMLVDLASDPAFKSKSIRRSVTRWNLYTDFFDWLGQRETGKPTRSPIDADARLNFMQATALWLWTERDGATAFAADEVPSRILKDLPDGNADDEDEKKREYLVGSFFDRNYGSNYSFPHRSFAEFLVARAIISEKFSERPNYELHERNSYLFKGGVAEFLHQIPAEWDFSAWPASLKYVWGDVSLEYLEFIYRVVGDDAIESQADQCLLDPIFKFIRYYSEYGAIQENILKDLFERASSESIYVLIYALHSPRFLEIILQSIETNRLAAIIVANLSNRMFALASKSQSSVAIEIAGERGSDLLHVMSYAVSLVDADNIILDWRDLGVGTNQTLATNHYPRVGEFGVGRIRTLPNERFTLQELAPMLTPVAYHYLDLMLHNAQSMSDIIDIEKNDRKASKSVSQ